MNTVVKEARLRFQQRDVHGGVTLLVDNLRTRHDQKKREGDLLTGPNLLLMGPPRVGKSLLAQRLEAGGGWLWVEYDYYRSAYWQIEDRLVRRSARELFYTTIAKTFPSGILLEGDDLLSADRSCVAGLDSGIDPLSAEHIQRLRRVSNFNYAAVGSATCTPEDKLRGMKRAHMVEPCWAVGMGEERLAQMALGITGLSQRIQTLCLEHAIPFFDIHPDEFAPHLVTAWRHLVATNPGRRALPPLARWSALT